MEHGQHEVGLLLVELQSSPSRLFAYYGVTGKAKSNITALGSTENSSQHQDAQPSCIHQGLFAFIKRRETSLHSNTPCSREWENIHNKTSVLNRPRSSLWSPALGWGSHQKPLDESHRFPAVSLFPAHPHSRSGREDTFPASGSLTLFKLSVVIIVLRFSLMPPRGPNHTERL